MRKFLVADMQGVAANGKRLSVGKTTHGVGAPDDVYSQVAKWCADSPLLAALQHPSFSPNAGQRLFQFDQWQVSVTGDQPRAYTVVKELPAPEVTLDQKLAFAMLAVAEVYHDPDYLKWVDAWLTGLDRTAVTAHAIEQQMQKETEADDALEVLKAHGDISEKDLDTMRQKAALPKHIVTIARAAQLAAANDPAQASDVAKRCGEARGPVRHRPAPERQAS